MGIAARLREQHCPHHKPQEVAGPRPNKRPTTWMGTHLTIIVVTAAASDRSEESCRHSTASCHRRCTESGCTCGEAVLTESLARSGPFSPARASFRVLYVFAAMEIGSRRILHCNVTEHPTAEWTIQQFPGIPGLRSSIPIRRSRPGQHFFAETRSRVERLRRARAEDASPNSPSKCIL